MILGEKHSFWIIAFVVSIIALFDAQSALARHGGGHRHHRRHHASHKVRGNPNITRRVAKQALLEKLPDLAALIGIDPGTDPDLSGADAQLGQPTLPEDSAAFAMMTNALNQDKATEKKTVVKGYNDSEVEENESPDVANEVDDDLEDLPQENMMAFRTEFAKYMSTLNGNTQGTLVTDNGVDKQVMMEALISWLGTRYHFGGMGRRGIDCSAFTGMMYRSQSLRLPRTAAAQWDAGIKIDPSEMQFGDLVFFHTRRAVYVSHVGMYLGNGMFAQASSRNGVTVSALSGSYYATHFIGARRFNINQQTQPTAALNTQNSTQN